MIDYQDAVQNPRNAFADPELKAGTVATSPLGLPLAYSGGFALTYPVQVGRKKFAVRCFHRSVPDVQSRYAKISAKLRSLASPYFVNFDFQPAGIRVRGAPYPVVKMDWVEGDTLAVYLDRASLTPPTLASLRQGFATLAEFLERNCVAHGDIQNENVIVSSGGALRLIDYDGMFVTGMPEGVGSEVGHKHFQHPGRTTGLFGPTMDRFSFIIVDVSLEALQSEPSLYRRFREGGQAIIFKANDFIDPEASEVFGVLNHMPHVRDSAKKLAAVCLAPITRVPTLADFRAGRQIPAAPIGTRPSTPPTPTYIGAFSVVDATEFSAVLRRVGDKIELVGKIVSVKEGTGKRGRGRGRPYVFINFGQWNKESVKITIWSEGLSNIQSRPTKSWEGKWISVTGLVEPPYDGRHYGKPYRNVGITVTAEGQIVHVSEQDAKYRLGRAGSRQTRAAPRSPDKPSNEDILKDLGIGPYTPTPTGQGATRPLPTPQPVQTKNKDILDQIKRGIGQKGVTVPPTSSSPPAPKPWPSPSPPPPEPTLLSRIPTIAWFALLFVAVMYLLSHAK